MVCVHILKMIESCLWYAILLSFLPKPITIIYDMKLHIFQSIYWNMTHFVHNKHECFCNPAFFSKISLISPTHFFTP